MPGCEPGGKGSTPFPHPSGFLVFLVVILFEVIVALVIAVNLFQLGRRMLENLGPTVGSLKWLGGQPAKRRTADWTLELLFDVNGTWRKGRLMCLNPAFDVRRQAHRNQMVDPAI